MGLNIEDGNGNKDGNTNTQINIGIGLELIRTLLQRENTLVIATKRALSTDSSELEGFSRVQGSRLVVVILASDIGDGTEKEKENTLDDLVGRLRNEGVERIDTLILNAGAATSFESVEETSVQELQAHFQINTVWPIRIYQVLRPLLMASSVSGEGREKRIQKKVVYVSSYLGSIGGMEDETLSLAYGISKAAGNYFVRKLHFEEEGRGVVCVAVHPGWVKTDNGQAFADSLGVKEPPMSLEESVSGVMRQVC
ncbi:hypothetical protein BGAL_0155g00190 [Botrytis galanthina]|uniref:Uncharacterized protein n=1 Tax=Botrytis galanthina TaxID=278940 RepID=A0A4S8R1C6_9HELO|nr:hypothetical protein BGAL_0155g00190 [Botrytis galanthina]